MSCAICKKNTLKQFIREDMIVCFVCKNVYDSSKLKISQK